MRRAAWGGLVGLVSALVAGALTAFRSATALEWFWYGLLGVALAVMTRRTRPALAIAAAAGALLGVLGWLLFTLTLTPLSQGHVPTWSTTVAAMTYPELIGDVVRGGLAGVILAAVPAALTRDRVRRVRARRPSRVVIVGGGFAGVSAAKRFERLALRGAPIDVTLVSDSNFLLFTPMLAEVASGAVEAAHISVPIRSSVTHTRFRYGTVDLIDADAREVRLSEYEPIPYDHLVLAVGSVPYTFDLPGVEEYSFTLKNLGDATRLRNHVLGLLEQAEQRSDPELLTFVVAGAGFAGTEMIAELFDLVHGVSHYFPGIEPEQPRFVLVHAGDHILPELPGELGAYALERLRARGIECRLGVRVTGADADRVWLGDGESIPTRTFVWAAGNRPSPLVERDKLVTDAALRVIGLDRVWAVGDCARIPDVTRGGQPCPPTAQHALRQGRVAADNIAATIAGRPPTDFRFRTLGVLVALGHRTAAADIRGRHFSGLAAWLLWRGIYLSKLPGIQKRIRVLFDWVLELAFPRDIVVTSEQDNEVRVR